MDVEIAKQLIYEAKATNSTKLDLSCNDSKPLTSTVLKELIPEIKKIKGLQLLNLRNNNLRDVDFLRELPKLITLNLRNNPIEDLSFLKANSELLTLSLLRTNISDITPLKELNKLRLLSLSSDNLTNLEALENLKQLESLNLGKNGATNFNFLKELHRITSLSLNLDAIKDYKSLNELANLESLALRFTTNTDIDFVKNLKSLKYLNLQFNKLSNIEFLKDLKGLKSLNLNNNRLTNVNVLKELINLQTLSLSFNNLTDIGVLKYLVKLEKLELRNNQISSLEFLKYLTKLKRIRVNNNPLDLPRNLRRASTLKRRDIIQIFQYYEQLEEGVDYIYEAKVLIVGEPKAGKTTLTQKIKDNKKWNEELKGNDSIQTVGVDIDTLPFPYCKDKTKRITAHFWDFGGQDIQYVLHQYFFTERSLYVLLGDGRPEFLNFNYWFEIIATLGRKCPVLVVLNENRGKPVKTFNINEYRKEFGKYLGSIEEESVNFYDDSDGRFENLKNKIENKTSNLGHIGMHLPQTWVDVRKELEILKETKPYIEKDDFLAICEKCNLINKNYQAQVIDYLHDLGIALNYRYDSNLRNKFILQPNWVIDALYVVLKDNKIEKDCGMFEVEYVEGLWQEEGYSYKDCEILLDLMQKGKFEIAYRLYNSDKFIVPILLPYKLVVDYQFENKNPIQTYFQYTFMPKGIVPRLIVRLHRNILIKGNEQIVWNKGVFLKHYESIAEVIEREQSKRISIKVSGENPIHNKELLTFIRNELINIHNDWFENRLVFDELVPCICKVCEKLETKGENHFFKLKDLNRRVIELRKETIECPHSAEDVYVRQLLEGIYVENVNRKGDFGFMSGNTFNIGKVDQLNTDPKDNVSITQNYYSNNSDEVFKKLNEMIAKLDEKQTQELSDLAEKLIEVIDEKFAQTNKLNDEQIEEFEEVKRKYSNETKLKIKQTIPFEWFIKQFTGFSVELEKELKTSKEIDPDIFIGKFRKLLYGANVEENILQLKD